MPTNSASPRNTFLDLLLKKYAPYFVFFICYIVYLLTSYPTVQAEDSGELITSALALDIAHPPGYPLYVLLGKLFSILIPFGNPAWRVTIMSGFFSAAMITFLYLALKKIVKNDFIALAGSFMVAFSNILWSQTNRAEVYSLNAFFVTLIIYLLYRWSETENDKWLYLTALSYGLALTNHHESFLLAPAILLFVLIRKIKILIQPKTILLSIAMFALGLSIYAYLPIRSTISPYDNPAFIEHQPLNTFEKFSDFINRKIYGGTLPVNEENLEKEEAAKKLPGWIIAIENTYKNYSTDFLRNNSDGLIPFSKIIARELFYLPLLFIIPGLFFIFEKNRRFAIFIYALLFMTGSGMMMLISIAKNADKISYFSAQPFFIPAIILTGLITACGFAWLKENIGNKKVALSFTVILLLIPLFALQKNFAANDQSKNYVAYDFNRALLESLPPNGYLISTGRDNMTFPLYYLRKIEQIRPDIHLEIYYSSAKLDEHFLLNKLIDNNLKTVFIDLMPPNFQNIAIKPSNFLFQYGEDPLVTTNQPGNFLPRPFKKNAPFPDTRLQGAYYLKLALAYHFDQSKQNEFYTKFLNEINDTNLTNFLADYSLSQNNLALAEQAYQKSGNSQGLKLVENLKQGIPNDPTEFNPAGME